MHPPSTGKTENLLLMIRRFIQLEWKSFLRAASFKVNMTFKIIGGVVALFYALMILSLGISAFYSIKKEGLEPLATINRYLIYWWIFDLIIRYVFQKNPVMWVRPLLSQPIKKTTLTHYLLGKSAFSFFNFYPLFFFIPFSIALLINGYSIVGVICWHLAFVGITYFNNYLNLMVNNKNGVFIGLAIVLAALIGLQYYHYLDITLYTEPVFQSFYNTPWTIAFIWLALVVIYKFCYQYFYKSLYLDDAVQKKSRSTRATEFAWLNRYGLMGTFMKNDLKLILRNKRSRNTLFSSLVFLFYGLIFFTNPTYKDSEAMIVFASIFTSGGFLFNFGGLVPSWDSAYYPLMMSQNIKYQEYLASKWWLMVVATLLSMMLSVFYLFIGSRYYLAILAGGIYNIGINAHVTLLSGAYVKTPIDLEVSKKPFGNKKAINIRSILLSLPKFLLPILIFYIFYGLFNETIGFFSIAIVGLLGLAFRNKVFRQIERIYKKEKYSTLQAYKQQ